MWLYQASVPSEPLKMYANLCVIKCSVVNELAEGIFMYKSVYTRVCVRVCKLVKKYIGWCVFSIRDYISDDSIPLSL